jgi:hypothetical protein
LSVISAEKLVFPPEAQNQLIDIQSVGFSFYLWSPKYYQAIAKPPNANTKYLEKRAYAP